MLTMILSKSISYGMFAGGSIQAIISAVGEETGRGADLSPGLYSLIGVIAVALITAFVNLKIAGQRDDTKKIKRLERENREKDKIIAALIAKEVADNET